MSGDAEAARAAAEAIAGVPIEGLRPVEPGTGGQAWMVAFPGPAFLCLDDALRAERSRARVCDVAQALLAAELVDDMLDPQALREFGASVQVLARWEGEIPAAVQALGRAGVAAAELAAWCEDPSRVVASLVQVDAAVLIQGRAHAAYATFAGVTEPLVQRQDQLEPGMLAALVAVEQAAAAAGLGGAIGRMLAEGMPGIVEAADEMAAAHVTPLR